jgi:Spy/CpxP family protein refolding chaperone
MKHLMMALSLALVSSVVLAQPATTPAGGAKSNGKAAPIARMQDNLDLTDEQVKKMREIRDGGGSREEMQAVLTPEQQAKAAALRKAHKSERGDRRDRMQEQLGLSDEQMKEMAAIRQKGGSREDMRAVLTPEQQAKFDALRSQHPRSGPKSAQPVAVKPAAAKPAAAKPAANPASSPAPTPVE